MRSYFDGMIRYCEFAGRSSRRQYWTFFLVQYLLTCAAIYSDVTIGGRHLGDGIAGLPATLFVSLIHALPGWALLVRRLHDIGRSGWWLWIAAVPIVGSIVLLVWTYFASEEGSNQYGPPVGMAYVVPHDNPVRAPRSSIPRLVRMGSEQSRAGGNRPAPTEGRFI